MDLNCLKHVGTKEKKKKKKGVLDGAPNEDLHDQVDHLLGACNDFLKNIHQHIEKKPSASPSSPCLSTCMNKLLVKVQQLVQIANEINNVTSSSSSHVTTFVKTRENFDPLIPTPMEWQCQSDQDGVISKTTSQPSVWSGFYNKTLRERFDVLTLMYPRLLRVNAHAESNDLIKDASEPIAQLGQLPIRTANLMIENCIGVLGIPLGLGLNFIIDGKSLSVPMAVEEPSVVAAASSGAKVVAAYGGFHTATSGNIMTSQIQLIDTPDIDQAIQAIKENRERLLGVANTTLCPNMYKRGGGALDIYCRVVHKPHPRDFSTRSSQDNRSSHSGYWYKPSDGELIVEVAEQQVSYLVVHIDVDVCEAMGANIVNTVAEGLSSEVSRITNSRCGLRILTNLCMQRRARSSFEIPLKKLGWKGVEGEAVASRIIEAFNFAAIDPYRAVTNNKGIMNGIDAVAIATGQDWRAIEAAAHCYASRSGQYKSLSKFEILQKDDGIKVLRGSLELPISVGSKGGALQTHPGYAATHSILRQPSARTLSGIIVSVGLAQNFAAIRALAITGIQQGHMALHARNIAVAAGAPSELVAELCSYMLGRKSINLETAKEYLQAHAVFSEIHTFQTPPPSPFGTVPLPSMLYVELVVPHMERKLSLNIAFETLGQNPRCISIVPPSPSTIATTSTEMNSTKQSTSEIQIQLLGDKGYNQLQKMFSFLSSMKMILTHPNSTKSSSPSSRVMESLDLSHPSSTSTSTSTSTTTSTLGRANLELQNKLQLLSILINILTYRLMEMHHQQHTLVKDFFVTILQKGYHTRMIDGQTRQELLSKVPYEDPVLSTGLPLFVALWQVLHYHMEQEVPHILLRENILKEQWLLLHSIVTSFTLDMSSSFIQVEEDDDVMLKKQLCSYMATHGKRWQATMLLLIDLLAVGSEGLTPERLGFLRRIGEYIEWEGTLAHDIARYPHSMPEEEVTVPNVYAFWLRQKKISIPIGEATDKYASAFRSLMDNISIQRWNQIVNEKESKEDGFFSLNAVQTVVELIRQNYLKKDGRRPRTESF